MAIKINRIVFREFLGMEEPARRARTITANSDNLADLAALLEDSGSLSTLSSAIGTVAGELLSPSSKCESVMLDGVEHWADSRYRFTIDLQEGSFESGSGNVERYIIAGYTDRAGLDRHDEVYGDTRMYINAMVRLAGTIDRRGYGEEKYRVLSEVSVLASSKEISQLGGDCEVGLTPYHVFETLSGLIDGYDSAGGIDECIPLGALLAVDGHATSRSNHTAADYLSSLIGNDYAGNNKALSDGSDYDFMETSREGHARNFSREGAIELSQNAFIRELRRYSDDDYARQRTNFLYEDLFDVIGSARATYDRTQVFPAKVDDTDFESERWFGATPEVVAAYTSVHGIVSMATLHLFERVEFFVTNDNVSNRVEFGIVHADSYVLDSRGEPIEIPREMYRSFESRVVREIFEPLSRRGTDLIDLHVTCNINGFIRVEVSIGGEVARPYVYPACMDAMLSTLVSSNLESLHDLCLDYNDIRREVDNVLGDGYDEKSALARICDDRKRGGRRSDSRNDRGGRSSVSDFDNLL